MKKLAGLAAAGLLALGTANAGNLTVANSDMILYGGLSASLNIHPDHRLDGGTKDADFFTVDTYALGLMKPATPDSPVGFNAAIAGFWVKLANGAFVKNFAYNQRLWLGYFSLAPAEGLTVDAGLIWQKMGEAPITILNKFVTRPIIFAYQPVAFGGLRISYKASDMLSFYVGYNGDSALGGTHKDGEVITSTSRTPVYDNAGNTIGYTETTSTSVDSKYALEAGVKADLGMVKVGANLWQADNGNDIINLCAGTKVANVDLKVEYTNVKSDGKVNFDKVNSFLVYVTPSFDMIELPVRFEYIKVDPPAGDSLSASFITVTPTVHPTKNSFVRLEIAYGTGDEGLANAQDTTKGSGTTVIAEFGYLF